MAYKIVYSMLEQNQTTQNQTETSFYQLPAPSAHKNAPKKTTKQGLREGWTRVTFILKEEHIEKLKAIAYWDRTTIKEIIDEAVSRYLENKKIMSK